MDPLFTPYDSLGLRDSKGMAFKCLDEAEYKVDYHHNLEGPGVIKRQGEKVFWHLFFGGIPRYMDKDEVENRRAVTLNLIRRNKGSIVHIIESGVDLYINDRERLFDEQETKERRREMESYLYDPAKEGLAEYLLRPKIGMKLAIGLMIYNYETGNDRDRIIVSKPITDIYCLP
ncbi:MAG: hypothetical protein ACP5NS_03930 [Candidatus Pacearchaeota archaeon]